MKRKRNCNPGAIKLEKCYTIEEAAELLDKHPNTISHWEKAGLPVMRQEKPHLIKGAALAYFLRTLRQSRKQFCQPDEMFCVKCQEPRKPEGGMVEATIYNASQLLLHGKCEECGKRINRRGGVKKLPEYGKTFTIFALHNQHLIVRS
jgi:hypothetical protein